MNIVHKIKICQLNLFLEETLQFLGQSYVYFLLFIFNLKEKEKSMLKNLLYESEIIDSNI